MTTTSFLPEDYLEQKAERRTNMISLSLFGIVMISVFAAFLVTNRQWSHVRKARASINSQYEDAAVQIKRLTELERQRDQMLTKARLAAALVERVPRSILLAELINRMPPRMGLLSLSLKSDRLQPARARQRGGVARLRRPTRAKTREQLAAENAGEEKQIDVPRYRVKIRLVGVAPTDIEVSRYIAALNAHPLLTQVTLKYSEERKLEGSRSRQFEIAMELNNNVDVRDVAPMIKRRTVTDPRTDASKITTPIDRPLASARPRREGG
ncbi:MAG: PilN domain-containing protein [Planctomycetes bacterium]|nr:PilN domain-containing protein [Planctomycetota bacterium]